MADVVPILVKIADVILLPFFLLIAVFVLLIDVQICFPTRTFPQFLVDLKEWYIEEFDDFLMVERPPLIVAAVWLVILFQWPLAIASIFGIIGKKSWYKTTYLMYGVSACSVMAPVLGHMIGTGKASDKMVMIHSSVLGPALIAILRGLVPPPIPFKSSAKKSE
ncbi:uncharacterized protein LOC131220507 [Magnolia sinica]|uniref:uncharacterized protein LOC131220507 n=1 Tax=Magnolia sinica TaxID=86752 RepID=UPI00265ADFF3|nr:uncharacterized protein LOC131220507 [Magnolia sinica]